jgi:hypothetical protein
MNIPEATWNEYLDALRSLVRALDSAVATQERIRNELQRTLPLYPPQGEPSGENEPLTGKDYEEQERASHTH